MTATIIKFHGNPRPVQHFRLGQAVIVILPVIKIERFTEPLSETPKRRRKRRGLGAALAQVML